VRTFFLFCFVVFVPGCSFLFFVCTCPCPRLHDFLHPLHFLLLGLSKWDVKVSPSASPVPPIFTASSSTSNFVLHFHAVFHLPASNFSELCLFSFALHLNFPAFSYSHLCSLHLLSLLPSCFPYGLHHTDYWVDRQRPQRKGIHHPRTRRLWREAVRVVIRPPHVPFVPSSES